MKIIILLYAVLGFLAGCSTDSSLERPEMETSVFYRRDMIITVNGKSFEGMGVVRAQDIYKFHIEARGELDQFIFSSCNRDWVKESAWNVKTKVRSGLFGWGRKLVDKKREFEFEYKPIEEIERTYCPVWLSGVEKQKGRHSFGFVDFLTADLIIPARVECNGEVFNTRGGFACQSRKRKIQVIEFADEFVVAPEGSCSFGQNRGTRFEFMLPRGDCVYLFKRIKRPHLEFRLTTYGYDKIPIRN